MRLYQSSKLKRRLIPRDTRVPGARECGLTQWNGKPIPLELHHINGDSTDNRIENIRILCPNCHAQTPTYRGKNIGSSM